MDALRPAGDSPPATFVSRAEKVEVWLSSDMTPSDSPIVPAHIPTHTNSASSPAMSKETKPRGVPSADEVASQLMGESSYLHNRFENTLKVLQSFSKSGTSEQATHTKHDSTVGAALQEVADLRNRVRTLLSPVKPPKSDLSELDVSRHAVEARHAYGSLDVAEHGMPAASIHISQTRRQRTPHSKSEMESMRKSTENLLASEDVADLVRNAMQHVRSRIHDFPSALSRTRELSSPPPKPVAGPLAEAPKPRDPPVHASTSTDSPPSQSPARPPLHPQPTTTNKQSPQASAAHVVEPVSKPLAQADVVQPAIPRSKQKPAPMVAKADAKTMRALQIQRGGWSKDISEDDDDIFPAGVRTTSKAAASRNNNEVAVKASEPLSEAAVRSSARALQTSTCFDVNVTFQPEKVAAPLSAKSEVDAVKAVVLAASTIARSPPAAHAEEVQGQDTQTSRACVLLGSTVNIASIALAGPVPAAGGSTGSNVHSLYTSPAGEKESLPDADCSRITASPMWALDITTTQSSTEHPQSEPIDDVSLVISLLDDPEAFDDMLQPNKKPSKHHSAMMWTPSIQVSHAHASQQQAPIGPIYSGGDYIRTAVHQNGANTAGAPAQSNTIAHTHHAVTQQEAGLEYPSSYWDEDDVDDGNDTGVNDASGMAPGEHEIYSSQQKQTHKEGVVLDAFEAIRASRELLQEQSFEDASELFSISFIDAHMHTHMAQTHQPWRPCGSSTGTKLRPRTGAGTSSTMRQARPSTAKARLSTQPTKRR